LSLRIDILSRLSSRYADIVSGLPSKDPDRVKRDSVLFYLEKMEGLLKEVLSKEPKTVNNWRDVMKDCKVLALCSQKGGVGKTTSCVNLAVGLAKAGKKVLVIDNDPQGSMTASLGYHNPDELPITLATILTKIVEDEPFENTLGILHHQEGIDLIPANIELSGMEVSLVNIMSRELVLKQYIERMREEYDYILIDCMPSLGMLTINALASVDAVIIPVQAAYLPVKGLEQLIRTIGKVRRQLNKQLKIGGILITMVDNRTNYARDISDLIFDTYGNQIKIFPQSIPFSVRAASSSRIVTGESILSLSTLSSFPCGNESVSASRRPMSVLLP
jgi:chromosome partitioning protein